ncbi:hypothetical protein [Pseudooctadecabacter sp.]|uniref:hypothetical protein n=1 Tax=Pseudooctadecabacter sp. TaxID=1966338 RepID=UPI0025D9B289|nr:hypothetical protein [Pseudooctadecabacter sp.]
MERILNMILRRLVNMGVNRGIDAVAKRGRGKGQTTQQDRDMERQGRQSAKNMRQASKVIKRLNRF